ncbi:MAG: hypothetical protein AAF184_04445 [Pseudomonadota bacterium]
MGASPLLGLLSAASLGGGLWLLRERWGGRVGRRVGLSAAWALLFACAAASSWVVGAELGIAVALVALSVAAPALVLTGIEHRSGRARRVREGRRNSSTDEASIDPQARTRRAWRATVRWLAAFFVAGLLALGISMLFATRAPLGEVDRIALAGLAIPVLWAGCMAWLFMTGRVLQLTVALACVGGVSLALALV